MSTPHVTTKRHASVKAPISAPSASRKAEAPAAVPAVPCSAQGHQVLDPEALRQIVAEVAYYRAEQRGFAPGGELQDWLEAEAQVDARRRA